MVKQKTIYYGQDGLYIDNLNFNDENSCWSGEELLYVLNLWI